MGFIRSQSNPKSAGQALAAVLVEAGLSEGRRAEPRVIADPAPRRLRRLNEQEQATLAQDYVGGMTVYQLATKFGISRDTISKHLKRLGVEMRNAGLTEEQIDEAVRLYSDGWSAQRIGDRLGAYPQTMRRRLLERGVRMRDTHGRER